MYDYFFIEWKEKPLCLICKKKLSASKLFSVKRHYKILHEAKYVGFVGKSREDLVEKLQSSLSAQQNTFTNVVERTEKSVIASYVVAEKLPVLPDHSRMGNLLETVCRRLQRLCF